jgi:hypothetical protein
MKAKSDGGISLDSHQGEFNVKQGFTAPVARQARAGQPSRFTASVVVVSLAAAGVTSGCTNRPYANAQEQAQNACASLGPKAMSGALIGGLAGAAGGAAIGAAAGGGHGAGLGALAGLAAGALAGGVIGNQADTRDCIEAQQALQQVGMVGVGQPVSWSNAATGSHGSYTVTGAEYTQNGQVCRPIRADYYMKDHQPVVGDTGVVCRTPSGDWQRVTS